MNIRTYLLECVQRFLRLRILAYLLVGGLAMLQSGCKKNDTTSATSVGDPSATAPPSTTGSAQTERKLLWNFWLNTNVDAYEPAREPVPEEEYTARFALAPLDFTRLGDGSGTTLPPSKDLLDLINMAKRSRRSKLDLTLVVTPLDPKRLDITSKSVSGFWIDLDRLRTLDTFIETNPPSGITTGATGINALTDEFIKSVSIARFDFNFRLHSGRSAKALISIFDRTSGLPVQTMTVDLASQALAADERVTFAPDSLPPSDFTLVLQDAGDDGPANLIATLAILHREDASYEFVTWNTNDDITSLMNGIRSLMDSMDTLSFGESRTKGWILGKLIFAPRVVATSPELSKVNQESAAHARQTLQRALRSAHGEAPKVMLVRITKPGGSRQPYASPALPVGLIALGDTAEKSEFLGDHLITSLVLPGQSFETTPACDTDWFIASPSSTLNYDSALSTAMTTARKFEDFARPYVHRQEPNLSSLKAWLADDSAPRKRYVFAFLGHNSDTGDLYLDPTIAKIQATQILREFDSGSIAILDACETATPEISSGTAIGRLARQNVGSTIATLGTVHGDVAGAYLDCVSDTLRAGKTLTVGELHYRVQQCLAHGPYGQNRKEAMKYLFVGNPFQRICKPRRTK